MILMAYRDGLRACEVVGLEWHQVELDQGRLHVRRAKNGSPSAHPRGRDSGVAAAPLRSANLRALSTPKPGLCELGGRSSANLGFR
jgi:integrase